MYYQHNLFYIVHPEITEQHNNSTVTTPEMAEFRCIATGVPRPTIEWYYGYSISDGNRLMNNTNNVMIVEENIGNRILLSTLTLTTTTYPDDGGNYTCRAVNIVDDYISSALLNVQCMLPRVNNSG